MTGPTRLCARPSGGLAGLARSSLTPSRLALGRACAGSVMLVRPVSLAGSLGVDRPTAERSAWVAQMLGVRELALGVGAWTSLRRDDRRASRLWLVAGMVSDAVDAVVLAGAVGRGRVHSAPGAAVVLVATAAAAAQAAALTEG